MGDIADMMLEGLLDEETGEYIGDINAGIYGTESPGFPISYEREMREGYERDASKHNRSIGRKFPCPICGKKCKAVGLSEHMKAKHADLI